MAKQLKDILAGVKSSKIVPGSTGSDPGVDYAPKAPNEQKFVKKHSTEKHADRVGNDDDVYQATNVKHSQASEPAHGHKSPKDKAVYESKKVGDVVDVSSSKNNPDFKTKATVKYVGKGFSIAKDKSGKQHTIKHEETKCNMTEEGTACPVHEMADCSKPKKTLKEIAKKAVHIKVKNKTHKFAVTSKLSEDLAVPLIGSHDQDDDESAEMAKTQLRALANKALHLAMQLNDDQMVEPWVQSKIAVAKDYVTAVHDYMVYGDHDKETEKEQTAPYDGGIDMTGAPRNTFPSFAADVNTGRNV